MKLTVQFVVCDDDGHEETFTDVVVLEKACQRIAHLGLALAEAKQTLTALQKRLVEQQSAAFVAAHWQCEHCGKSAVQVVQAVEMDLDAAVANHGEGTARKLYKAVEEFYTYREQQGFYSQ